MKILFFNYEYPPLGGGAANASFYILREYAKYPDLEVDFVTSSIDGEYHQEYVSEKVIVHRLPIGKNADNLHFQSQRDLLAYTRAAIKFAKKLSKEKDFDLTHSFFTVPCGYISMRLKRKSGLPYIISLRGADVPGYSERFKFLYAFITPIIRKIWNESDFVIANSEGLKQLADSSKPNKTIGVIYNGIDVHEFAPDVSKKDSSVFKILCVSRITQRKGIRYLIQGFKQLFEKYPNVRLEIIGDGNERKSLQDLVLSLNLRDVVSFRGLIPHEEIAQAYQTADVFVLPSLNEGMSNTMLEALASGLPIIATDTGGTKELVTEGENGFIIAMRDSKDIADKIEGLIKDPQLKQLMSQNSRMRAESLSWENVASGYVNLYTQVRNLRKMRQL